MEDNFFTKLSEMVKKLEDAKKEVDKNKIERSNKKFIDKAKKLKIKSSGYDLISSKENRDHLSSLLKKVFNNKAINNVIENFINNTEIDLDKFKKAKNEYKSSKENANTVKDWLRELKSAFKLCKKGNGAITKTQILKMLMNICKIIKNPETNLGFQKEDEIFFGTKGNDIQKKMNKRFEDVGLLMEVTAPIARRLLKLIEKFDKDLLDKAQVKSKFYNDKSKTLKELAEFIKKISSPKNFSKDLDQKQIEKVKDDLAKIIENIELEADNLIKKNMLDKKDNQQMIMINEDISKYISDIHKKSFIEKFGDGDFSYLSETKFQNKPVSSIEMFGKSFKDWKPKIEDIEQGNLGDCYLLAALLSLCKSNPDLIKDCFSGAENVDEYGKIGIKFYKIQLTCENDEYIANPKDRITIEINNTILVEQNKSNAYFNNHKKKWVDMFEKAYIKYISTIVNIIGDNEKSKKYVSNFRQKIVTLKLSPTTIEGISSPFIPLTAITGKPYSCIGDFKGELKDNILGKIRSFDKDKNMNMTIGFNPHAIDKVLIKNKALLGRHAYSVTKVEFNKNDNDYYVYLDNPHHFWYFDLTCLPDDLSQNLENDWINNCFTIIGIDDIKSQEFIKTIDDYFNDAKKNEKIEKLIAQDRNKFVKENIIGIMLYIRQKNPNALNPFLKEENIKKGESVKLRLGQIEQTPDLVGNIDYN